MECSFRLAAGEPCVVDFGAVLHETELLNEVVCRDALDVRCTIGEPAVLKQGHGCGFNPESLDLGSV